jgi:hypothetical protein
MRVQYSLFVLRAKEYELEKKIHIGRQEGWIDKVEEEHLEGQVESLKEGIKILEGHL